MGPVIRVDLRVVPTTRDRHVREASIDARFSHSLCVDLQQHAVYGLPLAAVAGHRIAVVEMGMRVELEYDWTARIPTHVEMPPCVDLLEGPQFTRFSTCCCVYGAVICTR